MCSVLSADIGYGNFDAWLTEKGQTAYERIPLGKSLTV